MSYSLVVTCEHAGNEVPERFSYLFKGHDTVLNSHQGWDPGAWELAQFLSSMASAPLFGCFTTRLLIEANRSLHHPQLFSSYSSQLEAADKQLLLDEVYHPYRNEVEKTIHALGSPVLHISMHTFTPVLEGKERQVEVGLLFDPSRHTELLFCERLRQHLTIRLQGLRIKFNEPYQGIDDGFTTYLRTRLSAEQYLGVEIEVNQKLIGSPWWTKIGDALGAAF